MILFSDFDFTLDPHTNEAAFNRNLVMVDQFRQAGHVFCLTTGRNLSSIRRVWLDYRQHLDFIVLDNGAVGINNQDQIIFERIITPDLIQKIRDFITSHCQDSEIELVYYYNNDSHRTPDGRVTKVRCYIVDKTKGIAVNNYINQTFPGLLKAFFAPDTQTINYPWQDQPRTFETFIDIVSVQAGKETAIHTIKKLLPSQRIITVGDGNNDLAMLREFDGYAMSNSEPEVLAVIPSDHIVKTVADLIKKLLAEYS